MNNNNKIETRGFDQTSEGRVYSGDNATLTGNWEINFHGCWWEVLSKKKNFWVIGAYPEFTKEKEPEHGCAEYNIEWEIYGPSGNPYYEKHYANDTPVLWRNGKCKNCGRLVRRVYKLTETYDSKNHNPIEL